MALAPRRAASVRATYADCLRAPPRGRPRGQVTSSVEQGGGAYLDVQYKSTGISELVVVKWKEKGRAEGVVGGGVVEVMELELEAILMSPRQSSMDPAAQHSPA
jgi:hypothetical protein